MNSGLNLSTPPSEFEDEFFGVGEQVGLMAQAERVARGFARGRNKQRDFAFVDECIAEAYYVVVEMYWTHFERIKLKFPDIIERHKFMRMSIGYRLKAYWSYRATSSISYLKQKGIIEKHEPITDQIASKDCSLQQYIALENAVRNEIEARVVELFKIGNDRELIAHKLSMKPRRVKRILTRVKKRLLQCR